MATSLRVFAYATYLYFMVWLAAGVILLTFAGGLDPVLIGSGSMSPLIRTGDVVLARPPVSLEAASRLGPGTVITFRSDALERERLVTHRIFAVSTDGTYITKGDANAGPDSDAVAPDDIVGVGRILVPLVGLPAVWLSGGDWLHLVTWLAATVLALYGVSSHGRRRLSGTPDAGLPHPGSTVEGAARSAPHPVWSPRSSVPQVASSSIAERDRHVSHLTPGDEDRRPQPQADGPAGRSPRPRQAGIVSALLRVMVVLSLIGTVGLAVGASHAAFGDATASAGNAITASEWKKIVDLDGGATHACLARDEGHVWCWGRNDQGQLGDGTTTDRWTPVQVKGAGGTGVLADVVALGSGAKFNCAATEDGAVWCWGDNPEGQLGDNTTSDRTTPVQVKGAAGSGTLTDAIDVDAGESFACAVKSDGSVWCWGRNDMGQLGNGTTSDSLVPVQVVGAGGSGTLSGVASVTAGMKHACAVKADGSVWCWGLNNEGQLGDNTTSNSSSPVQVKGPGGSGTLAGMVEAAAGESSTCAVKSDGTAWCWGRNDKGQLGNGTTGDSEAPVQVKGAGGSGTLDNAVTLASGQKHACAVRTDRSVWCWGLNNNGQLGNDTTADSSYPVQVTGPGGSGTLMDAVVAGAGTLFSCAAQSDYTVWCWGDNSNGQLGDNTTTDRSVPAQVKGGGWTGVFSDVVDLAGGSLHTCAVKSDGSVWCWGRNDRGQLGNTTTTDSEVPVQVKGAGGSGTLTGVISATAGLKFACAVKSDGSVWCWGENNEGQLGDNTTSNSSFPVQVKGPGGSGTLSGVSEAAAGEMFACAAKSDGSVWCWGRNDRGQLGNNTTTDSEAPVQVTGPGGSGTLTGAAAVAAGTRFACAVKSDGSVWCWGENNEGQLGDNTTSNSSFPVQVKGPGGSGTLSGVSEAAAGDSSTCAVKGDGSVWCWGRNDRGQLGDNTTTDAETPVQVKGAGGSGTLTGVASIAVGAKHVCGVKADGTMWCWGHNDQGQLGDATTTDRSAPVQVTGAGGTGTFSDAAVTGAGAKHSCAAQSGGFVWCWGDNVEGQLGDGTTSDSSSPRQVL